MKKIHFLAITLFLGLSLTSCGDSKSNTSSANTVETKATAEVDEKTEAAVKAYEEYLVKYEELIKKMDAGEDVFDQVMELQEIAVVNAGNAARLEAVTDNNKRLQSENDRLQSELQAFKPSLFGFYRKK